MEAMLHPWTEFNLAMAGATAALVGLVIVAASVNIAKIIELQSSSLTARLASGIASLVLALIASALGLVPLISSVWFGTILIITSIGAAAFQVHAARAMLADPNPGVGSAGAVTSKFFTGFLPIASYVAAGVAILTEQPSGLYLAALGCLLAIISAVVVSWVALVEILR